jgi:hypothetical protein
MFNVLYFVCVSRKVFVFISSLCLHSILFLSYNFLEVSVVLVFYTKMGAIYKVFFHNLLLFFIFLRRIKTSRKSVLFKFLCTQNLGQSTKVCVNDSLKS